MNEQYDDGWITTGKCYNCGDRDTVFQYASYITWEWKWGFIPHPTKSIEKTCPACYRFEIDKSQQSYNK